MRIMKENQAKNVEKKLYVSDLPTDLNPEELANCLNGVYQSHTGTEETPVVKCWIASDAQYAYVEMRKEEDVAVLFEI